MFWSTRRFGGSLDPLNSRRPPVGARSAWIELHILQTGHSEAHLRQTVRECFANGWSTRPALKKLLRRSSGGASPGTNELLAAGSAAALCKFRIVDRPWEGPSSHRPAASLWTASFRRRWRNASVVSIPDSVAPNSTMPSGAPANVTSLGHRRLRRANFRSSLDVKRGTCEYCTGQRYKKRCR